MPAEWVGKVVSIRVTADQIRIVADGQTLAEHARCFTYDQLICDPWHYLPVLEKKPGALRHGAPFQDGNLPEPTQQVRKRLLQQKQGDRALVDCLLLAREHGIEILEAACQWALDNGSVTGSMIQNEMRRLTQPSRPEPLNVSQHLRLNKEPQADYQRYDHLLGGRHVH